MHLLLSLPPFLVKGKVDDSSLTSNQRHTEYCAHHEMAQNVSRIAKIRV